MSSLVVVSFAVGLLVLCILAKILSLPLKLLWRFIANSVIGAIMLAIVNLAGSALFGATIHITVIKALIAGIFGVPGVIVVIIAELL